MKRAFISIIFLIVSLNLFAKEKLTIDDAISMAMNFNPEIKKFSEKVKGAEGRRMQLEAYPNPEIVFGREGLSKERIGESETNLGFFQTIETPGKRRIRKEIGETEEDIARMELERIRRIVVAKLKKVYFRAVFNQEKIKLLEGIEENLKDYIEGATLKYKAGEVSFSDVLRGRIELLKLKNEILETKKELREELKELGKIIGKKLDGEIELLTNLKFTPFEKSLNEILEELHSLPSIRIEELKLLVAEKGVELSKKSFYPDFKIGFYYPSLRKGAWGFEFGLSIPVFQKGLKGSLLEMDSYRIENQISLETRKREIALRVENLYLNLKDSEKIIKNYEELIFPELEDLFSSSLSYYQSGGISSLEFFDILRTFKSAKIEYKKEILNYINLIVEIESVEEE
jgi:outer membrane protein TolC